MKFLWISGWAVPPDWFAKTAAESFPEDTHRAVSPSTALDALAKEPYDILGGYSLGSLWLLKHQPMVPAKIPVLLLAPIFSFVKESGLGGQVTLAQLKLQKKRLRSNPEAAVKDFYERSGLIGKVASMRDFGAETTARLDAELNWLENWTVTTTPPANWHGYVGGKDPLLDSEKMQAFWLPINVIPQASHEPEMLLQAAAISFRSKTGQ